MFLLLEGILIGFAIAAPVGPIGILCVRRTLFEGKMAGFVSGLGAASADTFYGFIAGFGVTWVVNFFIAQSLWFHLIGGSFLVFLGLHSLFSPPAENREIVTCHHTLIGYYFSTLMLTLTNPMTIVAFVAIFAALGLGDISNHPVSITELILGVFIGSCLWWLGLSIVVNLFRDKLSSQHLIWINRLAGGLITLFGMAIWVLPS